MNARRGLGQAALYAAFIAVIGYFSSDPAYRSLAAEDALIRLTVSHAAQRSRPCRERTPEELAKLAPNMRAPLDCPRERASVAVELALDNEVLERVVVPPSGFARDGPSMLYRRIVVPAGTHRVRVRLADNAAGRYDYVAERETRLAPGRVLTIDFNAAAGGFIFMP